jgi:hypothetical protein
VHCRSELSALRRVLQRDAAFPHGVGEFRNECVELGRARRRPIDAQRASVVPVASWGRVRCTSNRSSGLCNNERSANEPRRVDPGVTEADGRYQCVRTSAFQVEGTHRPAEQRGEPLRSNHRSITSAHPALKISDAVVKVQALWVCVQRDAGSVPGFLQCRAIFILPTCAQQTRTAARSSRRLRSRRTTQGLILEISSTGGKFPSS